MCNLNILIKSNLCEKDNIKTPAFMMGVTSASFITNNDGDGLFIKDLLVRSKNKINLFKYFEEIVENDIIITHQRLATSGFESEYIQPFENKDFILIHNGVINDFLEDKGSDTFGFFRLFTKEFYNKTGLSREDRIVKIVKKLLNGISGSYSIVLYDKKTKKICYFKNDTTKIHFYSSKKMLFITTNELNGILLEKMFNHKFSELNIKDFMIYEIVIKNGKIVISTKGKIKKPIIEKFDSKQYFYNNKKLLREEKDFLEKYEYPGGYI